MRILVYPHELAMGGSQINALDLAGAVRDLGHDVFVFATPGVLQDRVEELRLPYIEAPPSRYAVDLATIRKLRAAVRELDIDIVHPYEWNAIVNTVFGPCLTAHTRAVMTVLSMDVPDFLPRHIPLIVGTQGLADLEGQRRSNIHVIEPPIDTEFNKPRDNSSLRRELGIDNQSLVISIVGRLTSDLGKVEGVLTAVGLVDRLAAAGKLTLLVAGDGEGATAVRELSTQVNRRHGRKVVHVLGNVLDPRPVYDAADIVLGMGSSALRGMSFGKPLIVQGHSGFWLTCSPDTESRFLKDGWFGGTGAGEAELEQALSGLLKDPSRRVRLGAYGRRLVEERFSLNGAAEHLLGIYRMQLSTKQRAAAKTVSIARTGVETLKFRLALKLQEHSSAADGS
ncbi:glycosyltransferase [Pseudarthrobacter phenanthrenivorans]|uniref:Glycosyltransferase n=1 Tax=Pseudarthrobacter phenanthrenivorans TaxID=361575 RepID=A0A3B0F6T2_PSEPS|nr:glycosyltransferase family 4 protein [Pseudarthrobacter phenanthrenivorans]RKO22596.1 glycosyltransferase [Pseudarthrobacter phenanthrenivorans]